VLNTAADGGIASGIHSPGVIIMRLGSLLLTAFRHKIEEPDFDSGLSRVATITGQKLDPAEFYASLSEALTKGYIRDPIELLPGALQCHWHLELTPAGVNEVLKLLRQHGKSAAELLTDDSASDFRSVLRAQSSAGSKAGPIEWRHAKRYKVHMKYTL
jgi:hypothetical protein